jgi:hypothetical protein
MSQSQFTDGSHGARTIQPGDTPTLDDLGVSVAMAQQNINKGDPCYIIDGNVTLAKSTAAPQDTYPLTPCVPTESKDNSGGPAGSKQIRVVLPGQVVALQGDNAFTVGQYGTIATVSSTVGFYPLAQTGVNTTRKFARYLGKEAAIFHIGTNSPYNQTLTGGITPDHSLTSGEVGWFQLVESAL